MAELYDAADVYVMSPLIQHAGNDIGVLCFGTSCSIYSVRRCTLPRKSRRNALLVPPGSPEHLANACFRILEEPGLASRLAAEGYKDCIERYSVASVRDQWHRFYKGLLNGS